MKDRLARRAIARWMYTRTRDQIVRPGGPYVFRALVDAEGNIYDLLLQYDWGPVGTRIDYTRVKGSTVRGRWSWIRRPRPGAGGGSRACWR